MWPGGMPPLARIAEKGKVGWSAPHEALNRPMKPERPFPEHTKSDNCAKKACGDTNEASP